MGADNGDGNAIRAPIIGRIAKVFVNEGDTVAKGDRIAQGVVAPVWQARFEVVEELASSGRGPGGFGSTGS